MAFQVPSVFTAVDKFSRPMQRMETGVRDFASTSVAGMARTERATKAVTESVGGLLDNVFNLQNAVAVGIAGVAVGAVVNLQQKIEATRKEASLFSGETGDALDRISASAQTTADLFDKDVNEVLVSTNALAKGMGLSFDEAGEKLQQAFVIGADRSGELLEIVKEYPGLMKQAGLSADAFLGVINTSADLGIFGDKGIDVIKEGDIRLREFTKATSEAVDGLGLNSVKLQKDLRAGAITTFDVMQMVGKRLGEIPKDSAIVGTAIADIFGGPGEDAGIEYLKLLAEIDQTQNGLVGSLDPFQQAQLDLTQSTQKLNLVFNQMFGEADGGFTQLKASVIGVLAEGLEQIVPVVQEIIQETRAWVSENEGLLKSGLMGFINGVAGSIRFLVNNIETIITVAKIFAGVVGTLIAIQMTSIAVNRTMAATIAVVRAAQFAYNLVLGVTNAIQGKSLILSRRSRVALVAHSIATKGIMIATKAWSVVQTAFNAVMMANPIGLIIAGILVLIGVVTLVINKWETWGAALAIVLGPLGFIISLIQSFRRNWDMIKESFASGGIIAGLRAIGATILDAVLMPIQQVLELVSSIPGLNFAGDLAADLERFRAQTLGVATDSPAEQVNTAADQEQLAVQREERITESRLTIGVNDPGGQLNIDDETAPGIGVEVTPTFNFDQ